jgi:EAL domain-containing protein (putative c-di-GMP-specific phosphodiesterase class I)
MKKLDPPQTHDAPRALEPGEYRLLVRIYRAAAGIFLCSAVISFLYALQSPQAGWWGIALLAPSAFAIAGNLFAIAWVSLRKSRPKKIIPGGIALTLANFFLYVLASLALIAVRAPLLRDPNALASISLGFPPFAIMLCFFLRKKRALIVFLALMLGLFVAQELAIAKFMNHATTLDPFSIIREGLCIAAVFLGATLNRHLREGLMHKQDYLEDMAFIDQESGLPNVRALISAMDALAKDADEGNGLFVIAGIRLFRLEEMSERMGHENMIGWLMRFAGELSVLMDMWTRETRPDAKPLQMYRVEYSFLVFPLPISVSLYRSTGELPEALTVTVAETLKNLHSDALVGFNGAYAVYPIDARASGELLTNMIGVLRRAPQEDRGRFIAFDGTAFGEYLQTERIKEQILSDSFFHELRSVFQPKVSAKTGRCEGFEALARWRSPIFGNVSPGDFISLAEQVHAIDTVTRKSLADLLAFVDKARARSLAPVRIAFNLSPILLSRSYAENLASWIGKNDLAPWIEVEITEGIFLNATESVGESLAIIRAAGATVAIDDFGTGYSNLGYLQHFAASVLKIDKRFIDGIPGDRGSVSLVRAIIQMSKAFDLKIVAEGVENADQLAFLAEEGCEIIQGYFFSKPLEEADALDWLESHGVTHEST